MKSGYSEPPPPQCFGRFFYKIRPEPSRPIKQCLKIPFLQCLPETGQSAGFELGSMEAICGIRHGASFRKFVPQTNLSHPTLTRHSLHSVSAETSLSARQSDLTAAVSQGSLDRASLTN